MQYSCQVEILKRNHEVMRFLVEPKCCAVSYVDAVIFTSASVRTQPGSSTRTHIDNGGGSRSCRSNQISVTRRQVDQGLMIVNIGYS